jgi:hypothetical protein
MQDRQMKFYHCFYTDLPDEFVEANAAALIKWADGWQDKNRYYHRQRVIDTVVIDFFGNAKKEDWPRLMVQSKVLLERWMNNKGANYNGGYWESLAEDQRSPDRKPGVSGGKDAGLSSWLRPGSIYPLSNSAAGQGSSLTASQMQALYQAMMQATPSLAAQSASMLRNAYLYGEFEPAPKPALKREGVVAGEIVGYRCWKIQKGLLRSVYQKDVWLPGQVLEGRELGDWDSRGIHAWKDKGSKQYHDYIRGYLNQERDGGLWYIDQGPEHLRPAMVTGTVFLWGDVVEHERGWRAEFARVRSLDWLYPDETMMGREHEALEDLRTRYALSSPQGAST